MVITALTIAAAANAEPTEYHRVLGSGLAAASDESVLSSFRGGIVGTPTQVGLDIVSRSLELVTGERPFRPTTGDRSLEEASGRSSIVYEDYTVLVIREMVVRGLINEALDGLKTLGKPATSYRISGMTPAHIAFVYAMQERLTPYSMQELDVISVSDLGIDASSCFENTFGVLALRDEAEPETSFELVHIPNHAENCRAAGAAISDAMIGGRIPTPD